MADVSTKSLETSKDQGFDQGREDLILDANQKGEQREIQRMVLNEELEK